MFMLRVLKLINDGDIFICRLFVLNVNANVEQRQRANVQLTTLWVRIVDIFKNLDNIFLEFQDI